MWMMTNKHGHFIGASLDDKDVQSLPGIDKANGERLRVAGFKDVIESFLNSI